MRNSKKVLSELEEMQKELNESGNQSKTISFIGLFTDRELTWPLITSIALQISQQLSGVNAIFFYSASIFKSAGIQDHYIQYAIFATGFVNVIATIICVPLIDKLGRKPLLLYPIVLMILNFICLTVFLSIQVRSGLF